MEINFTKNNVKRKGVIGFSITTLLLGCWVPIFRGDYKWATIMLLLAIITFGIAQIVFAFIYNKIHAQTLLDDGYIPADDYSKQALIGAGLYSE